MNDPAMIEQYMWIIWLGIFVLSLVIEAIGADLVSIFFAAGSLVALIIAFIPEVPWWVEIIVFVVISIASLLALRPVIKRFMKRNIISSNVDEFIHETAIVTEKVDRLHIGAVKRGDITWTAIGLNDKDKFEVGEEVEILAIKGNKLIIGKKKGNPENA